MIGPFCSVHALTREPFKTGDIRIFRGIEDPDRADYDVGTRDFDMAVRALKLDCPALVLGLIFEAPHRRVELNMRPESQLVSYIFEVVLNFSRRAKYIDQSFGANENA